MVPLLSPLAALGSAATFGIADFSGGLAARRTPAPGVTLGVELFGLAALPLAIWTLPIGWDIHAALLTFAGGSLGGLGLIAFYRAMALSPIGVVAPITGVVAASLPTVAGVLSAEPLRAVQLAGVGLGLIAIAMINGVGATDPAGRTVGSRWPCWLGWASVYSSSCSMRPALPVSLLS